MPRKAYQVEGEKPSSGELRRERQSISSLVSSRAVSPASRFLPASGNPWTAIIEILIDPFLAVLLCDAVLASRKPAIAMTFSSADYCWRVVHRVSRILFSALTGLRYSS